MGGAAGGRDTTVAVEWGRRGHGHERAWGCGRG